MAGERQTLPLEQCMSAIIDYRGKSPKKTSFGIPLITAKIIKKGRIGKPEEFIAETDYEEWMRRGMPAKGDVVMTTEAPLGEIAQLDGSKVALAQRVITLRGKPELLDQTFLKFLMQSQPTQNELRSRATGTTVLGIRQSELRKVNLILPPLPEQKTIGHILGTLDDKIELNRKANETLEGIAQAIFKSWFIDFDPVRAKMEGRKPSGMDAATAALFPDSFQNSEKGEIPNGWKIGTLRNVCTAQGGFAFKSVDFMTSEYPVIKIKNIKSDKDVDVVDVEYLPEDIAEGAKDFWLKDGDLLMAMTGATVGKFGLLAISAGLPCLLNQRVCRFIPSPGLGEKVWFIYCALSQADIIEKVISRSGGSAQPNISAEGICSVELVVPPIDLILKFNQQLDASFEMILHNRKEIRTLAALRDTLLPKLMSGEIRPKNMGVQL